MCLYVYLKLCSADCKEMNQLYEFQAGIIFYLATFVWLCSLKHRHVKMTLKQVVLAINPTTVNYFMLNKYSKFNLILICMSIKYNQLFNYSNIF